MLKDAFARLGLPLNIGLEVGTLDTVKRYVARGLGVAVVSALCVTEDDRLRLEVVDVPREVGAETIYGVVLRRDKHRSVLLSDLVRLIASRG